MQKQLILFCGLPGSGKTTISRELCRITGGKLIDLDEFKKTDVDPLLVKSEIDPPEVRWTYYQKGLRAALALFATGTHTIIIDEVFHLAELRRKIANFCREQHITITWVEVRCPYDVVAQRLSSKPRIGHILSTEEALAMNRLFENIFEPFPTLSDGHIVVENTGSGRIEEVVVCILEKMHRG
ncbi:ATP-binding protein [Candidatus Campbellbacteria bacterium]|nr:MAG: ATP-binding protein [Candidatus Campbellbacteria bacterium]